MVNMEKRHIVAMLLLNYLVAASADFTSECPDKCKCFWSSGNKQAECSNAAFSDIPRTLSPDIQILNLTGNPLYEIQRHGFEDALLNNLKKLILKDCKLQTIQKSGLSGLMIMIELDLSHNDLTSLHSDTFKETKKIRWILLNRNKLEKLEDGLFNDLPFLQKIDLSYNYISQIGVMTFTNVPKLNNLRLESNKLERIELETLNSLTLSSLDIQMNPWRCDCYLQPFRNWVISKNLYNSAVTCAEPLKLGGREWESLNLTDFTCRPNILYPSTNVTLLSTNTLVTLSCQVYGNPLPEVRWALISEIHNETEIRQGEINVSENNTENIKWSNLTITNATNADDGEYMCVAENSDGRDERRITLSIVSGNSSERISDPETKHKVLSAMTGFSSLFVISILLLGGTCYCYCKKKTFEQMKMNSTNSKVLIKVSGKPEVETSLITALNLVSDAPRAYDDSPNSRLNGNYQIK